MYHLNNAWRSTQSETPTDSETPHSEKHNTADKYIACFAGVCIAGKIIIDILKKSIFPK